MIKAFQMSHLELNNDGNYKDSALPIGPKVTFFKTNPVQPLSAKPGYEGIVLESEKSQACIRVLIAVAVRYFIIAYYIIFY